jgi:hypothetical protein
MENAYLLISMVPGVIILAWLFLVAYPEYRSEQFRQELFILRDRLFDEAARGRIGFDHPAYKYLRTTINGYLRFAHKLGFLEFVFVSFALHRHESKIDFSDQFAKYISDLPLDARKLLILHRKTMQRLVIKKIIFGSSLSTSIFLFPFLARKAYGLAKRSRFVHLLEKPQVQHRFEKFDLAAHEYGRTAMI